MTKTNSPPTSTSACTLSACLKGKRVVICVGSGGVGKTTVSAALALGLAMRGEKVAVVTIDPAKRLATALGLDELSGEPRRIDLEQADPGRSIAAEGVKKGELWAMMLDAKRTFDEIVTRLEPDESKRASILANPVYRELSTSVAGSHELSAIAKLYELHEEHNFDVIVLDTPPSRNALDFLQAPTRLIGFLDGRALQVFLAPSGLTARLFGRGTGIAFAIFARVTGIDMLGELSTFFRSLTGVIDGFSERTRGVAALLRAQSTTFAIVTSPEPEPAREAVFLADKLAEAKMTRGGLIVNRVHSEGLHGKTQAQVSALLEPELGERLAARTAANLADFDMLARRDGATAVRLSEELNEPEPVLVPHLDEGVQDLAGLARIASYIFA